MVSSYVPDCWHVDSSLVRDAVGWEQLYRMRVVPWDQKVPTPALVDLVEKHWPTELPRGHTALVPGCGTGHDVFYLAGRGYDAVGSDISATAIARCKERATVNGQTNVRFFTADFFKHAHEQQFDIVYDYAFFTSMPPSSQEDWARICAECTRPGGVFVALMFPTDVTVGDGPPYVLSLDLYKRILEPYFELVHDDPACPSGPGRIGRERMLVWRRRI
ncbi:thiol methyltransferase 1 [Thamnocephalis sphaerospora]|uniref:Thiol methyltransferase 1 n=1 Tax=Thamnocephalis sphaerospora TaxID=78915 RepID=A0A4P9XJ75_9FUNG|nr:thiol methyltransferase 1 [Thamnocephalis sphaerospora]|eukprot:RKP05792.1 thiol methyltransferase 1 [Thamnocephalis sphaerospora]